MIRIDSVTQYVVITGLIGAIVWDLLTWWWGLPTSSSHALIGGYAGAAVMRSGMARDHCRGLVQDPDLHRGGADHGAGVWAGRSWSRFSGFCETKLRGGSMPGFASCNCSRRRLTAWGTAAMTRRRPWASSPARCMERIIDWPTELAGNWGQFRWPIILAAHTAIALGTYFGGWRIVHTMGSRITKLKPVGGFCAETAGAITLFSTALAGIPVSTTHTITGAIVGVGATHRLSAVRWGVARRIVWAWVLTIPASALVAAAIAFCAGAIDSSGRVVLSHY